MNIRGAEMVPGGEVEKKEVKMSNTALLSLHAHPLLSFLNPLLKSQKKKKKNKPQNCGLCMLPGFTKLILCPSSS